MSFFSPMLQHTATKRSWIFVWMGLHVVGLYRYLPGGTTTALGGCSALVFFATAAFWKIEAVMSAMAESPRLRWHDWLAPVLFFLIVVLSVSGLGAAGAGIHHMFFVVCHLPNGLSWMFTAGSFFLILEGTLNALFAQNQ